MFPEIERANAEAMIMRPPCENEHRGLSYEEASRLALNLVKAAARKQFWIHLPEHLSTLCVTMEINRKGLTR